MHKFRISKKLQTYYKVRFCTKKSPPQKEDFIIYYEENLLELRDELPAGFGCPHFAVFAGGV